MTIRGKHNTMDFRGLRLEVGRVALYDDVWDDLRFPAQGIDPAGSTSPPDVSTDDGSLLFSSITDEVVTVIAQMPHAWKAGTSIIPHVHWSKSTSASGTVAWKCEYKMANPGDVFGSFTTLATATSPVAGTPDSDTAEQHLISSFGELDMTGMEISCIIVFRITRDVSEDTYGADAKLWEFDIHHIINTLGSDEQFEKTDRD